MILDFPEDIAHLRRYAKSVSLESVLNRSCDVEFLKTLDEFLRRACLKKTSLLGCLLPSKLSKTIPVKNDAWDLIKEYCKIRLNDDRYAPTQLFETMVCIFQPAGVGVKIGQNIIKSLEPDLEFDKKELLVGPTRKIQFRKEGVLTNSHWLLYDQKIPGGNKTGAFLDELLITVRDSSIKPEHFGLRTNPNVALDIGNYYQSITKAYIFGPRGFSEEKLQNPNFPEDPSGTVTEHRRVGSNPIYDLFPLGPSTSEAVTTCKVGHIIFNIS